jgi:hypothetical protein
VFALSDSDQTAQQAALSKEPAEARATCVTPSGSTGPRAVETGMISALVLSHVAGGAERFRGFEEEMRDWKGIVEAHQVSAVAPNRSGWESC